ncbi:hypothetical protein GLOTRDRAFT_122871 [Gloeophyllum trabeum ATCC 11539]|uniref:WW domain-containing protein n=1 Tax=Gloeophyllum trabeum (strain ATCC 11539 / FP-39264 / Madison 617) TaxID=670483 RepID=S7RDD7_GLOTA|nr:uncharacterized protein GLOTRDRAFT_122871 [Gloeophyllum trabeum ATCC 11539]EPQ52230.1 hypothetical protein GLOTRDRAFT_122871 [Gloeophyllum trabeum ATCC 11539]
MPSTTQAAVLNAVNFIRKLFPRSLRRFLFALLSKWIGYVKAWRTGRKGPSDRTGDRGRKASTYPGPPIKSHNDERAVVVCGSRIPPNISITTPTPRATMDSRAPGSPGSPISRSFPDLHRTVLEGGPPPISITLPTPKATMEVSPRSPASPIPRSSHSSPDIHRELLERLSAEDTTRYRWSNPLDSGHWRSTTPESIQLTESVQHAFSVAPPMGSRSSSHMSSLYVSQATSRAPSRGSSRAGSPSGSGRRSMFGRDNHSQSGLPSRPVSVVGSQAHSAYRTAPPKPHAAAIKRTPAGSREQLHDSSTPTNASGRNLPDGSVIVPPRSHISLEQAQPKPISPTNVARYARNVEIKKRSEDFTFHIQVQHRHTDPKDLYNVPEGWTACEHPEGALYFFHETKAIEYMIESSGLQRDPADELALELLEDEDGNQTCGYYFADTTRKTLFWLEEIKATESMLVEIEGPTWQSHIRHELESRYWYQISTIRLSHCEMFPCHRTVPDDTLQELLGTLIHGSIDSLTSSYSTFPWSHTDGSEMLKIIKGLKGQQAWALAAAVRLASLKGARLAANQPIYGKPEFPRSWRFRLLSPLLFYAPRMHLEQLEKIWVDQVIHYVLWQKAIDKLQEEWENLSLTTTVMLTVDVSFLAIQSVDVGSATPNQRCAAQIAIYFSTVASVGSIILGLLLNRHHRVISRDDAEVAQQYLWSKCHESRGLETLAIMYSLPYALLMWAMVTFLVSLSGLCFSVNPDVSATSTATRVPIGVAWIFVLTLIAWFLYTDWEGGNHPALARLLERVGEFRHKLFSHVSKRRDQSPVNLTKLRQLCSLQKTPLTSGTDVGNASGSQTV